MILNFSLGFLIKFAFIIICASVFYKNQHKIIESLVCGWLIMYVCLIALLLTLSCFQIMNKIGCLLGIGCCIVIALIVCHQYGGRQNLSIFLRNMRNALRHESAISYIVISGFLLLAVYIIGHNSLFFDSTWDAHTYQVPRIELFVQKKSLFINMRSDAINIFSNEWNGEINAIFYTILCKTNQGMFLANAENFIYSLLIIYWFCRKIGMNKNNAFIAIVGYCSMPAVVFLSMVVKGDFVTISFFLAAVIWLKDYIQSRNSYSLFFLMISSALAAGTKISMMPFWGLCFISVAAYLTVINKRNFYQIFRYIISIWKVLLLGIVCTVISCARYFLNSLYYGEFFKRVETANEKITISWQYFKTSIIELIKTLIDNDNIFTYEGSVWALNMDMGIIGSVFILLFLPTMIVWILKSKKQSSKIKEQFYVWFPIIGSMLFFMASTIWWSWSFRYYMPWMLVFFFVWILMLQELFSDMPKVMINVIVSAGVWIGMIGVISTIMLTTKEGEVTHSNWKDACQKSMIEREYGFHPYLLENNEGSPDIYDFFDQIKSEKKVLICNAMDTAVSYLFGIDNSNDITFCTPSEIMSMISETNYDVVSVSDIFLTPELEAYFGNDKWTCYTPVNDILKAHVFLATFEEKEAIEN